MDKYVMDPAVWEDAVDMAPRMRKAEVDEVWAAAHQTPLEALAASLEVSRDAQVWLVEGRPMALFGVGSWSVLNLNGIPWLLTAEGIEDHVRPFLRDCKQAVAAMREEYAILENYVDARNDKSVKWLRWMGFTIDPAKPFGVDQLPFHRLHWRRDQCAQ